jgi:hypothetical protein
MIRMRVHVCIYVCLRVCLCVYCECDRSASRFGVLRVSAGATSMGGCMQYLYASLVLCLYDATSGLDVVF